MSPIAATVIKPNFEYFEKLYRVHDSKIDELKVFDKELTKNKPRSLLSYICKKHVRLQGKNEELIKIFSFLIQEKVELKSDDERKHFFRSVVRSFAIENGNHH